jgi:hypothetical protein
LHPQHPNVDYAYYLKGLTSFDQDVGLLARFLPLDMTKRDPGAARDSYNEFAQLTSRYPNSRYAPDAKQRMIYLRKPAGSLRNPRSRLLPDPSGVCSRCQPWSLRGGKLPGNPIGRRRPGGDD